MAERYREVLHNNERKPLLNHYKTFIFSTKHIHFVEVNQLKGGHSCGSGMSHELCS